MRPIGPAWLVLLAAGALLAAGCQRRPVAAPPAPTPSSVTVTPGPDGVQAVTVQAGTRSAAGQYRFVPDTLTVSVGRVRLTFRNTGSTPHNLTFRDPVSGRQPVATATLRGGGEQQLDFAVSVPGRYRFVCTIHEALGQTGVLNVRP
jgi:plastocyanin